MGFFGGQSKAARDVSSGPAEQLDDLPELPQPRSDTVIAKGVTVSGKITGEGVVQVDGILEGEIDVKGLVTVSATGRIKGPIKSDVLHVSGCVDGDIVASEHLRLEGTGVINGDITTVSFVVEDGGRLNGRTTMTGADKAHPSTPKHSPDLSSAADAAKA